MAVIFRAARLYHSPLPPFVEQNLQWGTGVQSGATGEVDKTVKVTISAIGGLDTTIQMYPLYDMPNKPMTIDNNSLQTICQNNFPATSNDSPRMQPPPPIVVLDSNGNAIGNVYWTKTVNAKLQFSFRTWAVVYDTTTQRTVPLKEATWEINVDSALTNQHANTPTTFGGIAPTKLPPQAIVQTNPCSPVSVGDEKVIFTKE